MGDEIFPRCSGERRGERARRYGEATRTEVSLVSRRPAARRSRRDVSVAAERTVGRDRDEEVVVGRSSVGDDLRSLVVGG